MIQRVYLNAISTPWYVPLVIAYGLLIPVVAMSLPGVGGVGAADLLIPFGILALICFKKCGRIMLPHIALTCFVFAALLSLLQIHESKSAIDCMIRWVRLFGIFIPFFFGAYVPVDNRLLNRAFTAWMVGGLIAIVIGIFLHAFQIEVRQGQQRLWMDGASILRAGGLIGNSGAFGHMTSTWAVISMTFLLAISKNRLRFILAAAVALLTFYVIVISSSRAAMLHLLSAAGVFILLFRIPQLVRQWSVLGVIYGGLAIVLLACVMQCPPTKNGGSNSNVVETNLKRFVPGYGGSSAGEFTSNRAGNWPEYVEMMNEKILFGWGYKMGVRLHEESPDNSYLSVMLETGAIGFTCMSFFVIGIFYRLGTLYFARDPYACVLIPACVGQLFNCFTSDIYTFWITMPVVFMLLGLVIQKTPTPPPEIDCDSVPPMQAAL